MVIFKGMTLKMRIGIFLSLLTSIALSSCMVEQNLTLSPDHSGVWTLEGEAMPFTASAFDDLAILAGYDDAGALYDEAVINSRTDLAKRDDISSYRVDRKGEEGFEAEINFTDIETLLGSEEAEGIAEISSNGGIGTLSLRFDRERASQMEKLIPMMQDPSLSLFNPADTGGIGEEAYITGILGFTFGEENIPAIRRASIGMTVTLPGDVTEVKGGTQQGKRTVRFETPFTRFLVPDEPVYWSVSWKE